MASNQPPRKNAFRRLNTWFAGTLVGSFLYSHVLHHIDRLVYRLSGGRGFLSGFLAGIPVVLLLTRGRRSGAERAVPLIGIPDGDRVVLIASNWGRKRYPAWYHNLLADPEPRLRSSRGELPCTWRPADANERESYWEQAVNLYPGWAAYQRRIGDARDIPILVLAPNAGAASA